MSLSFLWCSGGLVVWVRVVFLVGFIVICLGVEKVWCVVVRWLLRWFVSGVVRVVVVVMVIFLMLVGVGWCGCG